MSEALVDSVLDECMSQFPSLLPLLLTSLTVNPLLAEGATPVAEAMTPTMDESTTVVLRYLPLGTTVESLTDLLESLGFADHADLVFIPVYHMTLTPMRIAVINFVSAEVLRLFVLAVHGLRLPHMQKPFVVGLAKIQGLKDNLAKILEWDFLANTLPSEFRPIIRVGHAFRHVQTALEHLH
jgi:hypothetical protein